LSNRDEQQPVAALLFLDDLITEEVFADGDPHEQFARALSPVLVLLEDYLVRTAAPVVIGWLSPRSGPVLSGARRQLIGRSVGQQFEAALYALAARFPALHVLCLDEVIADVGRARAFDTRNFYAAHCRLSNEGMAAVAAALATVLERIARPASKVLVLDCDNTLWGGVVGEDGLAGLRLGEDGEGAAFVEFQRVAQRMARQGLVLAIASKNNEREVWDVFDRHGAMVLKHEHISAWRIDWNEKAENITAIAEELGVGLDSIAFWDDNPLEREKVRTALPEVHVIEASDQVVEWPSQLSNAVEFAKFEITAEDQRKTDQYRARGAFVREAGGQSNRAAFLRSIELRPEALTIDAGNLARAAQLCAKTNQFNLRTMRHAAQDIAAMAAGEGVHCLVRLGDRFGDHGVVGLILVNRSPEDSAIAFIDTLLMSCRVLGRELDAWMLGLLLRRLRDIGIEQLVGEFVPTERNGQVASLYRDRGFAPFGTLDLVLAERLRAAIAPWTLGGDLFVADCRTTQILGLEIYAREAIPA
jgi:FkbH-like protein